MVTQRKRVIVVGELNVDLIMNGLDSLPLIEKEILANEMQLTLGSSSAIFANNLSVLGAEVSFIGKVGNDAFGQLVVERLSHSGVDTSAIISDEHLKTGVTVAMNFDNERAMVTYPGAMDQLCYTDIELATLSHANHLHVSSVFLQPKLKPYLRDLYAEAKRKGLTTSLDTQWDPMEEWDLDLAKLLPLVDVFLPNETELVQLTGQPTVESALNSIRAYANTVVVKLGHKGSASFYKGVFTHIPPFLNDMVVDAIGAGDSFNAGFLYQYLSGAAVKDCQVFGNLIGAVSTVAAGGTGAFTSRSAVMKIAKDKFNYSGNDIER